MQGERFDLNLLGATKMPIVTIETKPPRHKFTSKDYRDFFKRLKSFWFESAFITNGQVWERFDIEKRIPLDSEEEISKSSFIRKDVGEQSALFGELKKDKIGHSYSLDISRVTPDEAEAFFSTLEAHRYLDIKPEEMFPEDRNPISKKYPAIVTGFTQQLQQRIGVFVDVFDALFPSFRTGHCGDHQQRVSIRLFGEWCRKSYVLPPQELIEKLMQIQISARNSEMIAKDLKSWAFSSSASSRVADQISTKLQKDNWSPDNLLPLVWELYDESIETFLTQTTHVLIARLLLYRVGEDRGIFGERLIGESLKKVLSPGEGTFDTPSEPKCLLHIRKLQREMKRFSSTIYTEGDFDWWQVNENERHKLSEPEKSKLSELDKQLNRVVLGLLEMLAWYDFSAVDVDVWRNIYQHYLPEEERQRLGGFYTPDELIELLLDLAGYKASESELCNKSFLDLASGSGAFVVECLHRLLNHLKDPTMPCHAHLYKGEVTDWVRSEEILNIVEKNLHAVDIHPFASFLTYVNTLFVVLDDYKKVHDKDPKFRIDFQIFSANSLLKASQQAISPEMFNQANSRVQASIDALERYKKVISERFDFVVGNPPWGGILKGKISPIFDDQYKAKLALEFRDTYAGKLDIYGLFFDRGLRLLSPNGKLGLVTQTTYIDKDWAGPHVDNRKAHNSRVIKGLRRLLVEESNIFYIVDLNPFGQLFFHRMNTPCITILENKSPDLARNLQVVLSKKKSFPRDMTDDQRRKYVVHTVQNTLSHSKTNPYLQDFVSAFPFSRKTLKGFNGERWMLSPDEFHPLQSSSMFRLTDLLEPRQGVTPGGCLDVFLMDEGKVKALKLEKELTHKAIKSKQIERWSVRWEGRYLLYPYRIKGKEAVPAFTARQGNLKDVLDYDFVLDEDERNLRRRANSEKELRRLILEHRQAKGLVDFPNTARYLTKHYERLSSRIFEKKTFSAMGKQWYEYHRPRDPKLMLSKQRIVSPSLCKEGRLRFALDTNGYLSDHACQYLLITRAVEQNFKGFSSKLARIAGKKRLGKKQVLMYLLAFLNSSYAQRLLTTGRMPTPKGHYQIDEKYLSELYIPLPRDDEEFKRIVKEVERCMKAKGKIELTNAEQALDKVVMKLYNAAKPRKSKAKSKGRKPKK